MPELPEVQTLVSDLRPVLVGQKVRSIVVHEPLMLGEIAAKDFMLELQGKTLAAIERRGKYVLFHWKEGGLILLLHMGQAGWMEVRNKGEELPKHTKVSWLFGNGKTLHYINSRLLGVVAIIHNEDYSTHPSLMNMGPEAWSEKDGPIKVQVLAKQIMRSKRPVKEVITDQTVIAGLGNIWGDEVLFQAGIDPRRPANLLSQKESSGLVGAITAVIHKALAIHADLLALPENYLLRHRKIDDICPKCGKPLEKIKVGARHWYWCPRDQR